MDSLERTLGRIEEAQSNTKQKLLEIEAKLDKLTEFKLKVVGGSMAVSAVVSALIEMIRR